MLFNEMLLKRRKELSLTQDELAEKLAVSRQSVSRWENGECMPDAEKLIRLSEILEISLDELTGREVRMEPIVLEAPKIPKAKRPSPLWIVTAAAVCLLIGAAGFFIGRYAEKHLSGGSQAGRMAVALTVEDLEVDCTNAANNEYSLLFISNAVDNGVISFYPKGSSTASVSVQTLSCGNGLYTAGVSLEPNSKYEKAVYTADTGNGEQSFELMTHIITYDSDGISYNDHSKISYRKIADASYRGNIPDDGIVIGFDDHEANICISQPLETISYSDEDFIVPFDREKMFNAVLAHVLKTYTELSEEASLKLAKQITDGFERADKARHENGVEGVDYELTENGGRIYEIGRVVDGEFVPPGNG
ncbi:MAG: helix-turn-helix transcriptional regulator [Clostridia bacterium]|nr:helix-turn-helix transcriptional regulator [Clostridia bacterium]